MKRKKYLAVLAFLLAAGIFTMNRALADQGPVTMNANPQGLVTSDTVKLSLDTQDLARCRYSEEDSDYDDMEEMETPDGLYHFVSLDNLSDGSYTYYARCRDFMGIANEESTEFKFKVGDLGDTDDSGDDTDDGADSGDKTAPTIYSPTPSGTLYDPYVTLSVTTSEAADCRYSWYEKAFDEMTLVFSTTNRSYHTATQQLPSYGYYTYYVRCRDDAGNVNALAGKISFRYASQYTTTTPPVVTTTPPVAQDTEAPLISSLSPSGDVKTATTTLECSTNEKATCKYDTSDVDYDSMSGVMNQDTTQKSFHKDVALNQAGSYTYYIRCRDLAGNKSTTSSQIGFTYVVPVVEGPKISNVQPKGTVYAKNIALILQTDKAADCRYSTDDGEYEDMEGEFDTNDGLLQQAIIVLDGFGSYTYYVRCSDNSGNKSEESEVINFVYKDANAGDEEIVDTPSCEDDKDCKDDETCQEGKCVEKKEGVSPECEKVTSAEKDGACDPIADCVCDPDCPSSGKDVDSDCANVKPAQDNSWIVVLLIGIVLVVVIVIIIVIIKKRSGDEEDVELP